MTSEDRALSPGSVQARLTVRLEQRGHLFELYVTPMLRYRNNDSWRETIAAPTHPLREKWLRTLTTIVEKEVREEE